MSRRLLLPIVVAAAIATLADAANAPRPDKEVRFHQLQRNRYLVQALVDGGLRLAAETDPLRRADYCNGLAKHLALEMRESAGDAVAEEEGRAVELGEHLEKMIRQGVASNLYSVRQQTPSGSAREVEMHRIGDRAADLTRPLEKLLDAWPRSGPDELRTVLKSVREARQEVERALKPAVK